jgi:hypothetical protein
MKIFGSKSTIERTLDLKSVGQAVRQRMERISVGSVEPDLVMARLADAYRNAGVQPPDPSKVRALLARLDREGWRRFDLIVSSMAKAPAMFVDIATSTDALSQIKGAFLPLAQKKVAVTLAMTSESPLRIEEFARQLAAKLKLGIEGESIETSAARLARLDSERLLIDAELSKLSGKERSDYVVAIHRAERGKW